MKETEKHKINEEIKEVVKRKNYILTQWATWGLRNTKFGSVTALLKINSIPDRCESINWVLPEVLIWEERIGNIIIIKFRQKI